MASVWITPWIALHSVFLGEDRATSKISRGRQPSTFSTPDARCTSTDVEESSSTPAGSSPLLTALRRSRWRLGRTDNYYLKALPSSHKLSCVCDFLRDKAEKLEVILGRTFRKENSSSEQIFKVEKYWMHEKFDNESFDNDIGEWRTRIVLSRDPMMAEVNCLRQGCQTYGMQAKTGPLGCLIWPPWWILKKNNKKTPNTSCLRYFGQIIFINYE